ncbi:PREDICTED: pentatricopeptide repeat-containing protein At3g56030 [Nelumbo nucifera]|uniref:Pentatricopeptide repeat-containing protein-mitochondrial domain-containing protein n=2 Tax=Nelumbo nucifera TaxID=4432 RepID=A0A822YAE9_NELNU|nr:PREDICTED: pentatricopeptide repeat-containing protein At3g56030 [Nelumbo nucifera]DAD28086.1 TPA_asm: hypothetical protein HUJ06_029554 [Nelumbo nucifera]
MFILRKNPKEILRTPNASFFYITSRCLCSTTDTDEKAKLEFTDPDKPTSAHYDQLVNIAGHSRDFTTLHYLLNKRTKDGCFNTTNTFKFITGAEDDLSDLIQTLSRLDKGFARKSAFDALIARFCKLDQTERSLRLIDTMIRGEHGINACTFHPILNALTRKKSMEEARCVLALMKDNGITPDVTSYNYILTAYCVAGDLEAAAGVLREILEEGLEVDPRTYDAMVLGACKAGRVEGALALLRRMVDDGVPALYSTHAHVINWLMKLGCFGQAVELVLSYGGIDKGLDTENFGFLGRCLMRARRFKEAKLVLGEMDKRGLVMGQKLRTDYAELLQKPIKVTK